MRRGDGGEEGSPGCCGLCLDKYQFTPSIDLMRVLKMLSALKVGIDSCTPDAGHPRERWSPCHHGPIRKRTFHRFIKPLPFSVG